MRALGIATACALAFSPLGCRSNGVAVETKEPKVEAQKQNTRANKPVEKKKAQPAMHALGFELGARRADVRATIEKMRLPVKKVMGDVLRAEGQMLGLEARMTWAFKNDRLYTMVFKWTDATKGMTLQNSGAYRALSASHGAIDKKNSGTSYVRWTNTSGYVELKYARSKLKVRDAPHELTLTAQLYELPKEA